MRNLKYLGFFFLLPLVVGMPLSEEDSTEMNIKFAAGRGSYAFITRGCEGVTSEQNIPYKDIGVSVDYKLKPPVQVGLKAGTIWEEYKYEKYSYGIKIEEMTKSYANSYFNPNISFEGKRFGIGIGPFFSKKYLPHRGDRLWIKRSASWHLRIGSPKFYFSTHMFESIPLYSGGGYFNLGFGGSSGSKTDLWFGLSTTGPYDGAGFLVKTNFKLNRNWYLDLAGRLGISEGNAEHAISVGLNYRL